MRKHIILAVLVASCLAMCPQVCSCSADNIYNCNQCLVAYKRQYTTDCVCISTYVEMEPYGQYCVPMNCTTYNQSGCLSCGKNQQVQDFQCQCRKNYISLNGQCVCQSVNRPTRFYSFDSVCYVCPEGCRCNVSGCVECNNGLNRQVKRHILNTHTCFCSGSYVQINGTCQLYQGCYLVSDKLYCNESSHRYQNAVGQWQCKLPYRQKDQKCQCYGTYLFAFFRAPFLYQQCGCASQLYPSSYYHVNQQCKLCQFGCRCGYIGCFFCQAFTNRQIYGADCPCRQNYVEIDWKCMCLNPYYELVQEGALNECRCLSELFPDKYYQGDSCQKCPEGCQCDTSGCFNCTEQSLRVVTSNGTYNICNCHSSSVEKYGKCQCPFGLSAIGGVCQCQRGEYYYVDFNGSDACVACPYGCQCSVDGGCHLCSTQSRRQNIQNSTTSYFSCPCLQNMVEIDGICQCQQPYSWNSTACVCSYPYQLSGSRCVCKSLSNSSGFYLDKQTGRCLVCPPGCMCGPNGCGACNPNAGRWIGNVQNKFICNCLAQLNLLNGVCSYCHDGYRMINFQCQACPECEMCDSQGCTSCSEGMTLVNRLCVCQNSALTNIQGVCLCQFGNFYIWQINLCAPCPKFCETCTRDLTGPVVCKSCTPGVNRKNSPQSYCLCDDGFKESTPYEPFCCPYRCDTCNMTQCLTCNINTYRTLANGDCVCLSGFVEGYGGKCQCPPDKAVYNLECMSCPPECNTCIYMPSENYLPCISCKEGRNRNTSDIMCKCLNNFQQYLLKNEYCAPMYCLVTKSQGRCLICSSSRILSADQKSCNCPPNFYDTKVLDICQSCSIFQGCIDCNSPTNCILCNISAGYKAIVVNNTRICQKQSAEQRYIVRQSTNGLQLQIRLSQQAQKYTDIRSIGIKIYNKSISQSVYDPQTTLNLTFYKLITPSLLHLEFQNPTVNLSNRMINIQYEIINYTNRYLAAIAGDDAIGTYKGWYSNEYITLPKLYPQAMFEEITSVRVYAQSAFVVILFLGAMALYTFGYKHNMCMWLIQTIGMLSYSLLDEGFRRVSFMYGFKWALFDIGNFSMVMLPRGYLEESRGNVGILRKDGSYFRTSSLLFIIACILSVVITVLRLAFFTRLYTRNLHHETVVNSATKKYIYRLLEYLYKIIMYPMLFFSIIAILGWNSKILLSGVGLVGLPYNTASAMFGIITISIFTMLTVWQVWLETAAKVNRYQYLIEYCSCLLSSLIIALNPHSNNLLLLIPLIIIRELSTLFVRKWYLRDFIKHQYGRGIIIATASITIGLTSVDNVIPAIIFFLLSTIFLEIALEIVCIYLTKKMSKINKALRQAENLTQSGTSQVVISVVTQKQEDLKFGQPIVIKEGNSGDTPNATFDTIQPINV